MDEARLAAAFVRTRAEPEFRALYHAVTPSAYGLALRLAAGDVHEAADVVQEAWLRAMERLDRYRTGAPFGAWLRGFIVNCWRERARRRRRAAEVDLGDELADEASPEHEDAYADIDAAVLRRAVDALPAGFREVLILHDIEGCTHAEVAALLGIAEGTSKSQLHRARSRLRSLLRAHVHPEGTT